MKRFFKLSGAVLASILISLSAFGFTFFGCGKGAGGKVDLDLSAMSGTVVYAEVYNIVYSPSSYLGKTMRIKGSYAENYYAPTGKTYSYIVIADATACCSQGLEVELNGKSSPSYGDEIIVTGVFTSYEELGKTYYTVSATDITRA